MLCVNLPSEEPFWLDESIVKSMHGDQLAQHGGKLGVREMEVVVIMEQLAQDKETQESIASWLKKHSVKNE